MPRSAPLIAAVLAAGFSSAQATEYGLVLSSTPVSALVAVPQTVCHDEMQPMAPVTSGAGALFGAVLGGLVGSAIGGGSGQAAATGLGVIAGAMAGERNEALHSSPGLVPQRGATPAAASEPRLLGYDVVYEYQGQRYSTRVAEDPGSRIPLHVSVTPASGVVSESAPAYLPPQPQSVAPVYAAPPVYAYGPGYGHGYGYGHPYQVAPIAIMPSFVFGGHWHRRRHHR